MHKEERHPSFDKHALKNLEVKKKKLKTATRKYLNAIRHNQAHRSKFLRSYLRSKKKFHIALEQSLLTSDNLKALHQKIIDIKTHLAFPGLEPTLPLYEYSEANLENLEALYSERLIEREVRIAEYERLHPKSHKIETNSAKKAVNKNLDHRQEKAFNHWLDALTEHAEDEEMLHCSQKVSRIEHKYEKSVLANH